MTQLRLFIRLARPHFLLGGILLYALGVGIVHYLGLPVHWNVYILGQIWGTMLQLGTQFLNEYFDAPADNENDNRTWFTGGSGSLGEGKLPRPVALWAGLACLAVSASFTALLVATTHLSSAAVVVMILIFIASISYAVPPIKLESSGYGELVTAIIVANLVPGFAFLLQVPDLQRVLAMATFPLTPMALAMLLAIDFPDYGNDIKFDKRNLLVRAGWQAGMMMHNVFIILSYLLLVVAIFTGLPFSIALPFFFTLPVGFYQIYQMNRIAAGAKPNWNLLIFTAIALFMVSSYLLTFSFWTH